MDNGPLGIDLSHNNTPFNWDKLRPEIKFVIVKATEGISFKDPVFNNTWQILKKRNIIRGCYHFLNYADAQHQADNFLSRGVDFSKSGCLPPILDIEDAVPASGNAIILAHKPAWIQIALDWLRIIEEKTGRKPIIYSYKNYFAEYLNNDPRFCAYPLWLASYQSKEPGLPKGFSKYTFWQYSDRISATGSGAGAVDGDLFNGSLDELKLLANIK